MSKATVANYKQSLRKFSDFLEDKPIELIKLEDIEDYLMSRPLCPASMNNEKSIIRTFLKYCALYKGIRLSFEPSLIRHARVGDSKIKLLEANQVSDFLENVDDDFDRLVFYTMFCTGMRIGELVKFCVEDFHDSEITIRGKGDRQRVVPVPPELCVALRRHLRDNHITFGTVFQHQVHKNCLQDYAYKPDGIRTRLDIQAAKQGVKINPHMFRHSIATELLKGGMDIRSIQVFLGHKNISTTMKYTHITDSHLKDSYYRSYPKIYVKCR